MQLYGRGLRRRLPPMLGGDPRRLRMVYSLLFALPGTPVLFYGEEIGMGENLDVPGRLAVRTPMQWTSAENGGFSRAPARRLAAPLPDDGYAPEHVNVADQRRDPDSLLTFVRLLAHRYRECPELGWGEPEVLDQPEPSVLALRTTWQDASMVTLHNLSPDPVVVPLALGELPEGTRLVDLIDHEDVEPATDGTADVRLDGYGFRWLRITHPGSRRLL
jgi:glycosidase